MEEVEEHVKKAFGRSKKKAGKKRKFRMENDSVESSEDDTVDSVMTVNSVSLSTSVMYSAIRYGWNNLYGDVERITSADVRREWAAYKENMKYSLMGKPVINLADFVRVDESDGSSDVTVGEEIIISDLSDVSLLSIKGPGVTFPTENGELTEVPVRCRGKMRRLEIGRSAAFDKNSSPVGLLSKAAESSIVGFNILQKSPRQKYPPKYMNQDFCQLCWDGGILLLCDQCPACYHDKIECITNFKCLPNKHSRLWKCPHHRCGICQRTAEETKLIFPCEICPSAYCEYCLPQGVVFVGFCSRFEELGCPTPKDTLYIHCSEDCAHFSDTKAAEEYAEMKKLNEATVPNVTNVATDSKASDASTEQFRFHLLKNKFDAEKCKQIISRKRLSKRVTAVSETSDTSIEHKRFKLLKEEFGGEKCNQIICRLRLSKRGVEASEAKFMSLSEIYGIDERWKRISSNSQQLFRDLIWTVRERIEPTRNQIGKTQWVQLRKGNPEFSRRRGFLWQNVNDDTLLMHFFVAFDMVDKWSVREIQEVCWLLGVAWVYPVVVEPFLEYQSEPKFKYESS